MNQKPPRKTSIAGAGPGALYPMIAGQADHRIKNSLQLVASLLRLQADHDAVTRPDEALADAAARVGAVAHWHAFLSLTRNRGRRTVALDDYLRALADHFVDVFVARSRIVLLVNADPIEVPARVAGLLGQIMNELVTNAARQAFDAKGTGTIQVECGTDPDGAIVLQVCDNRNRHMDGRDPGKPRAFGMQVVAALVKQLGGKLGVRRAGGRVCRRVTIPMPGRIQSTGRKRQARGR